MRWTRHPSDSCHGPGEFVLYWMHNALRANENPALDVAICFARQNGLPLLVYRGLSEDYPYASDRYHAFMLQGHRDVQCELQRRGIDSPFHLQRNGNRGPHLRDLVRRSAVLVTEEMPVHPLTGWIDRLHAKTKTPIVTVDCSCIVPAPTMDRCFTRAYEYRDATKSEYEKRVGAPYHDEPVDCEIYDGPLPFQPLCLQDACLASLIADCKIDHSIGPVADTPGGSRHGYKRWDDFKTNRLKHYAAHRNDATKHDGVSRLSAYLHFGMVSPFRIAREAHAVNAEKFLDELLIWREMSFHFCFHHSDTIDTMEALPEWAQQTLAEHCEDERPVCYSWETLARGTTGYAFWDACQRSLLKHGELHNNTRMTWGKSFLSWANTPARALQLTMDVNHRYALDGRDPSSYGGVLWCYGQFDRPFEPELEVFGKVRPRCLEDHARRLDLDRYHNIVDRPIAANLPRVAIIGAGMAGLAAARTLRDHGINVTVFDKSRGVGGRIATRRVDQEDPGEAITLDHGAQYFTARDPRFCRHVNSWIHDQIVAPWLGKIVQINSSGEIVSQPRRTPRYVGVPGMNAVAKHLASDLTVQSGTVQLETQISRLERVDDGWILIDTSHVQHGPFETVICNCPPEQSALLLADHTDLMDQIAQVKMRPCWAILVASQSLDGVPFDGAFVDDSPISWIAQNSNKPGRPGPPAWVIHASAQWSEDNLDLANDEVLEELLPHFENLIGKKIVDPIYLTAHRWRFAIPAEPLSKECLWDHVNGLGACGDWCGGPRVEGAFLSGMAMAGTLLRHVTIDRAPATCVGPCTQPSLFN
ncbi:FAD-dependent oxidoreductase [Stieleria varia]|uniref:Protoporphyrinogen oxidase n=1 Tax=Stieleria varia TaxID=2528005 RepID=A0A5C6ANM0_9BACT|nr:FAD-dependent oxidoreductase [Stieleria varia]TWU00849.1 protoporphyrinogen oxidase [Stieleria varia]